MNDMPPENEAEFKVMTQNMYNGGGVIWVLNCLIEMAETQVVILRKLREIVKEKSDERTDN